MHIVPRRSPRRPPPHMRCLTSRQPRNHRLGTFGLLSLHRRNQRGLRKPSDVTCWRRMRSFSSFPRSQLPQLCCLPSGAGWNYRPAVATSPSGHRKRRRCDILVWLLTSKFINPPAEASKLGHYRFLAIKLVWKSVGIWRGQRTPNVLLTYHSFPRL